MKKRWVSYEVRYIVIVWGLLWGVNSRAQLLTVSDAHTQKPIEAAQVYSGSQGVLTDSLGKALLNAFQPGDTLSIRHISYENIQITWEELVAANYQVLLEEITLDLSEVTILFNRWAQRREEIPHQIAFITPDDISLQQPQTAADLLGISGEVFIQKSQQGGGSPMLRGFSANRVLLVVDGVRLNNAIYRSGNLHNVISLDPLATDHAEVIFGPGSVVYGSDALGGVMNFQTLSPTFAPTSQALNEGKASLRYASANHEKSAHLNFAHRTQHWTSLTSLTYSGFEDLLMGSNGPSEYLRPTYVERIAGEDLVVENDQPKRQRFTGYDQVNLMQKFSVKVGKRWKLAYAFHFSRTSDIPRYDRLIEIRDGEPRKSEWFYGPQIWHMHVLRGTYSGSTRFHDELQYTLAYQEYQESRHDRNFQHPELRVREEKVRVASFSMDARKKLGPGLEVFYGTEAIGNWVGSQAYTHSIETHLNLPLSTRYPDGSTWHSLAAYLRVQASHSPLWTFSGGIRYNHIFYHAPFNQDFFSFPFTELSNNLGAFNGSWGAIYRPQDTWQFSLNLSTGFRAPNIDDLGKVFDSEPGNVVVPNPDLAPEIAYTMDLGIEKKWGSNSRFSLTAFYTWLDNAMVRQDLTFEGQDSILYDGILSNVQADVNAENASIYGLQAHLATLLQPWLRMTSSLTWMRGEDQDGQAVRHVSPTFGSTQFIASHKAWRINFYTHYHGAIPYKRMAPSERNKPFIYAKDDSGNPFSPSWYTLNLKASYKLSDTWQGNIGLENITDQRYRPYSSGIVAAGSNLVIGITGSL